MKKAFSLVEISVVIVIIGILIAGIAKAIDLYQDFRLTSARNLTNNSIVNRINGLTFWVETTSERSFAKRSPNDGETISLWRNINPRPISNLNLDSTITPLPIYKAKSINSLPAIHFGNQSISRPNVLASELVGINQASLFVVHIYKGGNNTSFFWAIGGEGQRFLIHDIYGDSNLYFDFGYCCGSAERTQIATNRLEHLNNPKIITAIKNPNNAKIYDNGKLLTTNSSANENIPPTEIKNLSVGGDGGGNIVGEVIVFNRGLNDSERIEVEKYLSQKWGIGLAR